MTDTFPEDDASRTDNDRAAMGIAEAPWIFFPYPCKYIAYDVTDNDPIGDDAASDDVTGDVVINCDGINVVRNQFG